MSKMGQQDCAFQTSDRFVNNNKKQKTKIKHCISGSTHFDPWEWIPYWTKRLYRFETQGGWEDAVNHFSIPPKHIQEKSSGPPWSPFLDCMTVSWCVFVNRTDIHARFHHSVEIPPWGKNKRFLILQRIIYLCPLGPGSPLPSFLAYRRISFSNSFLDSIQTYSSTMSKAEGH